MKIYVRANGEIGTYRGIRYGIEESGDMLYYFVDKSGDVHKADTEEELFAIIDDYLSGRNLFAATESVPVPDILKKRPYVFTLNSVNSSWNDEIFGLVNDHNGIRVKSYEVNPKTGKLFQDAYWKYAVASKQAAEEIFKEANELHIPLHQSELQVVKTDWDNRYRITIEDYDSGDVETLKFNKTYKEGK